MKGKKILALTSIFASVALVGSTFALWAVTDNADPLNLTISPGTIATDDSTTRVTLSYGSSTTVSNVGNFVNNTKRLAATVQLKAEWDDATKEDTETFTGLFKVALAQTSSNATKLIDYLNVDVYSAAPTITNDVVTAVDSTKLIGSLAYNTAGHAAEFSVTLDNWATGAATKTVYVVVEYKSTTAQNIETMANDAVTMTLNWDKPNTGTVSAYTIYYMGSDTDVSVYAWNSDVSKTNDSHPGVAMTKVREYLYSYELLDDYAYFLFAHSGNKTNISGDITIGTAESDNWLKNCYNQGKVVYDSSTGDWVALPEYYVVGSFNMSGENWVLNDNNYKMRISGDYMVLEGVELHAGDKLKVYSTYNSGTYYTDENIAEWPAVKAVVDIDTSDNNNLVIKTDGTYNITFYPSGASNQNNYVGVVAA